MNKRTHTENKPYPVTIVEKPLTNPVLFFSFILTCRYFSIERVEVRKAESNIDVRET